MPLTDTAIRNAKAKKKPYKLSDEKGLYLYFRRLAVDSVVCANLFIH